MKHLKLYESYIEDHLKERGIDPDKTKLIIDNKSGDVFFFLYNLSGQITGYQKYNPNYPKKGQKKDDKTKYYNWMGYEGSEKYKKISVYGLESYKFTDKYLFITEGIFDIARVHQAGYPGIAVLCNDPNPELKKWLKTLPQIKIVIYDNDKAGYKLKSLGDYSFSVENGKDLNDLGMVESKIFLDNILKKLKINENFDENFEHFKKIDYSTFINKKNYSFNKKEFDYLLSKIVKYKNSVIYFSSVGYDKKILHIRLRFNRKEIYLKIKKYKDDYFLVEIPNYKEFYLVDQLYGFVKLFDFLNKNKINESFEEISFDSNLKFIPLEKHDIDFIKRKFNNWKLYVSSSVISLDYKFVRYNIRKMEDDYYIFYSNGYYYKADQLSGLIDIKKFIEEKEDKLEIGSLKESINNGFEEIPYNEWYDTNYIRYIDSDKFIISKYKNFFDDDLYIHNNSFTVISDSYRGDDPSVVITCDNDHYYYFYIVNKKCYKCDDLSGLISLFKYLKNNFNL